MDDHFLPHTFMAKMRSSNLWRHTLHYKEDIICYQKRVILFVTPLTSVTQRIPLFEAHIHDKDVIIDSVATHITLQECYATCTMGYSSGRKTQKLVFDVSRRFISLIN